MGIEDKGGMVAARNAQTEKNTSHSRRNKNFHAERYLSLFPTLLLHPRAHFPRRRDSVFLQDFTELFVGQLFPPAARRDSSVSFLSVTFISCRLCPARTRWHNFCAVISAIFLSPLQFYLQSPIRRGTGNASGQYGCGTSGQLFRCLSTSRISDVLAMVEGKYAYFCN